MKFINKKGFAIISLLTIMMSNTVNAAITSNDTVAKNLGDWVAIVAESLSILCLVVFALYMGKFFSIKTEQNREDDVKVTPGVKNGMMTALIGMAICQATIIVAQICF